MSAVAGGPLPRRPTFGTAFARGVMKRCPRCGGRGIFAGFFRLRERCPHCSFRFGREEGYWTGAMIINIAACEAWFGILFVSVLIVTLPSVPWAPLLAVAVLTNGLLPVIFYPWSKTIWMAFDVYYHWDSSDDLA